MELCEKRRGEIGYRLKGHETSPTINVFSRRKERSTGTAGREVFVEELAF
jgi:hypothetical protein